MVFYPEAFSEQFRLSRQIESSFSPTTDWEKVFGIGNMINRELNLTEKDISDEVSAYRSSKKKSRR